MPVSYTHLASVFPDVKSSYIYAYCEGGKTLYVAYTADGNTKPASMPGAADFKAGTYVWDGNTAGITSDGITLGTAPALSLGTSSLQMCIRDSYTPVVIEEVVDSNNGKCLYNKGDILYIRESYRITEQYNCLLYTSRCV